MKDTRQNFRLIGDSEVIRLGIVRIGTGKSACGEQSTSGHHKRVYRYQSDG